MVEVFEYLTPGLPMSRFYGFAEKTMAGKKNETTNIQDTPIVLPMFLPIFLPTFPADFPADVLPIVLPISLPIPLHIFC